MLTGNIKQLIIESNKPLDLKNTRAIYFKNLGGSNVKIGLLEINSYGEHRIDLADLTIENQFLDIAFEDDGSNDNKLYVEQTLFKDFKCLTK